MQPNPTTPGEAAAASDTAAIAQSLGVGAGGKPSAVPGRPKQSKKKSKRQPELDALRGLLLIWMTLTHLPTHVSAFANQPFGFVSAAEGFVFLSAMLTGKLYARLAYEADPATLHTKLWARALRVYGYHLVLLAFAFTVGAALAATGHRPMLHNLLDFYFAHPVVAVLSSLLLIYCPPLLDILPMYVIFLFLTPLLLLAGRRFGWGKILAISAFLWAGAQFGFRHWLDSGLARWTGVPIPIQAMGAFDLFAWQFLWALGVWLGGNLPRVTQFAKQLPRKVTYLALAVAILFAALRRDFPVDWFFSGHLSFLQDKWEFAPLRVINLACIILLAWSVRHKLREVLTVGPFPALGKASLQVFTAHVVFVFIGLAFIYQDTSEILHGWRARVLILLTLSGLIAIAMLWARHRRNEAIARAEKEASPDLTAPAEEAGAA